MNDNHPQLERIEQLLREGNELRRQAIGLQQQAVAAQSSLVGEQRAHLAKAGQINEQAMKVTQLGRRIQLVALPAIAVMVIYISYLLFSRF